MIAVLSVVAVGNGTHNNWTLPNKPWIVTERKDPKTTTTNNMSNPRPVPRIPRNNRSRRNDPDLDRDPEHVSPPPPPQSPSYSSTPPSPLESLSPIKTTSAKRRNRPPHPEILSPIPSTSKDSLPPHPPRRIPHPSADIEPTPDFKRQIDRLERDLLRRDRELEEERVENEKCLESIKRLERDKLELKREMDGLRDEADDYRRTLDEYKEQQQRPSSKSKRMDRNNESSDDQEDDDPYSKQAGLEITLAQKNRDIEQLLEDTERLDEEKRSLQEKLISLKSSLSEATQQIESITNDHFQLKSQLLKGDERIKQLEEEKTVLGIRERELLGYKERHDQYLENLCNAVDIRVDVWKKMMFDKDEEIDRLNNKISTLISQIPNTQLDSERSSVQFLNQKVSERDHQISLLNEQLATATEELESSSTFISTLKSKLNLASSSQKTTHTISSLQNSLSKVEETLSRKSKQLSHVEKEAEDKSRTITTLLDRISSYESGVYGLPEAVSEIKDLKIQIRIRDKQVAGVTQEINILHMQVSDLQEENEMLRDQVGLDKDADLTRSTRRYSRTMKNELSSLKSKLANFEEEIVTLKTRNYALKKQLSQYDHLAQQQLQQNPNPPSSLTLGGFQPPPDRDRDGPDGGSGSVAGSVSTDAATLNQGDLFIRNLTGFGVKEEEWKEKYEIILEENSALRRGLHEILDCMHKMTDEGNTEVMIQAPVLEELLREMSARGIISYPYPISSFHMKVCNLEGKCSQLREELHRTRQEERQCRQELFEAQTLLRTLTDEQQKHALDPLPSNSRSKSPTLKSSTPSSRPSSPPKSKHVSFTEFSSSDPDQLDHDHTSLLPTRRNFVLESLQEEITQLRSENESLITRLETEHASTLAQLSHLIKTANDLIHKDKDADSALKDGYLLAIQENQVNQINALLRKIATLENNSASRIGSLERFKMKAIHQISTFQQILENSVPIALFHTATAQVSSLTQRLQKMESQEESELLKSVEITKLRLERDTLTEQLSSCQARLIETAAQLDPNQPSITATLIRPQDNKNGDTSALKLQLTALESTNTAISSQLSTLSEKYNVLLQTQATLLPRSEYDLLLNKLTSTQESLTAAMDSSLKWKEYAELTQNQISAIETIHHFSKAEMDSLTQQVVQLASTSQEKALLAKAHHAMLTSDREKHLAIQQVEKLLGKLAQLEAHSLQADKLSQDRELSLLSMHTHVIMRYRNLFAALHASQTQAPSCLRGSPSSTTTSIKEALELFESTRTSIASLEEQLLQEKLKVDELREKCGMLEGVVATLRNENDSGHQDVIFESMQKVEDARLEITRWKRKAEQKERDCSSLTESLHRLASKTSQLEDDCNQLEQSIELKDTLTSTLLAKSMEQMQAHVHILTPTISSTSMPPLTSGSSTTLLNPNGQEDKECQAEGPHQTHFISDQVQTLLLEKNDLIHSVKRLEIKVAELEGSLRAKDEALGEIRLVRSQQIRPSSVAVADSADLQDALVVARESITSLHDRLKSKDDNVVQYRRLLAEVRSEMQTSTERHVQEMRALQMTIHHQQQAFTRMKSTLSHPVKDSLSVEGTIKDQLTRIHELEDEVSQLQHAMSNTAAQLTAARSEAHRWRCHAELKMKEADSIRDQGQSNLESLEELTSVRTELRDTHRRLDESLQQLASLRNSSVRDSSMTELVNVLRSELEEKDKQIEAYGKSLHNLKNSGTYTEKSSLEEKLGIKDTEINSLREQITQLAKTVSSQQVQISKFKATPHKPSELEVLRTKYQELADAKSKVDKEFADLKKSKSTENVSRWEDHKKLKASLKSKDLKISELSSEIEHAKNVSQNLRNAMTRLEKEKIILETKLLNPIHSATRSSSASTTTPSSSTFSQQQVQILAQGEIARLKIEMQDLQELNEKIEFEGKEEAERLKMEIKLLKERIVSQERQLTAYQIAQKGDTKVIAEIENMALRETQVQKQIRSLEEDNLHLSLQMEQLRLESPRLRDRVQHLQKMVEALKAEKPLLLETAAATENNKKSQRSLSELEKTIHALKGVINKLQSENKKLLQKPPMLQKNASTEKLKTSVGSMVEDKKLLLDKVHHLEHENEKVTRKFLESSSTVESLQAKLTDAENRAKSAEMKLRTFLNNNQTVPSSGSDQLPPPSDTTSGLDTLLHKMRTMQDDLDNKNRLLVAAKQSLRAAEKATAPKPASSPRSLRPPDDDHELPVAAATSAYLALV